MRNFVSNVLITIGALIIVGVVYHWSRWAGLILGGIILMGIGETIKNEQNNQNEQNNI